MEFTNAKPKFFQHRHAPSELDTYRHANAAAPVSAPTPRPITLNLNRGARPHFKEPHDRLAAVITHNTSQSMRGRPHATSFDGVEAHKGPNPAAVPPGRK